MLVEACFGARVSTGGMKVEEEQGARRLGAGVAGESFGEKEE